jgi:hypothetical protein
MDNLTKHHPEILALVEARTTEENQNRLREIETKMKDYMDIGLGVPHELRVESVIIVTTVDLLK